MKQLKKTLSIAITTLFLLAIVGYVGYAVYVASVSSPDDRCTAMHYYIEQNIHAGFITPATIEYNLRQANILPIERLMTDIRTRDIEHALSQNEFVEKVECYKTANNSVTVNVVQRTPVIYVMPQNGAGYYVDRLGKIIRKTSYPVNLPVATGNISRDYARNHLATLGNYIVNDDFWNNLIEQIDVTIDNEGNHSINFVPRIGNHIIHLGTIERFEQKLHKLKIFYCKALPKVGWNKYSTLDLEYEGQIICKKN